jgi:hypothetical protein
MTKHQEPRKSFAERIRSALKMTLLALVLAVAAFIGVDGYLNEWALSHKLMHGGELTLTDGRGDEWTLNEQSDFVLLPVDDIGQITNPDSLMAFDRRYAGYYRLYFRLSDSLSAKLKRLSDAAAKVDTGRMIERSIADAQTAYGVLRRIVGLDSGAIRDTSRVVAADTAVRKVESGMAMGSEQALSKVATQILKQPQVIAGIGVGLAAAAGMEAFQSENYLAFSRTNVFRIGEVSAAVRSGKWEGRPIDILWIFAQEDTTRRYWLQPAVIDTVQADTAFVDTTTAIQLPDSIHLMEE